MSAVGQLYTSGDERRTQSMAIMLFIVFLLEHVAADMEVLASEKGRSTSSHAGLQGLEDLNYMTGFTYSTNASHKWFFETCGNTGQHGPTQHQCNVAYQQHANSPEVEVIGSGDRLPAGVQTWAVPYSGIFSIAAVGASGGTGQYNTKAAKGDYVHAIFELKKGEKLHILVGQRGQSACGTHLDVKTAAICKRGGNDRDTNGTVFGGGGGGGGATYVFKVNETLGDEFELLLVAGGGGGRSVRSTRNTGSENIATGGLVPAGPGTSAEISVNFAHNRNLFDDATFPRPGGGGGWLARPPDTAAPMDGQGVHSEDHHVIDGLGDGGEPCRQASVFGWQTYGGFGGGGGACHAGGGGGGYTGGQASSRDSPIADGYGGSSYVNSNGISPYTIHDALEGDGAVEVMVTLECTCQFYCLITDASTRQFKCLCPANQALAEDGITCLKEHHIRELQAKMSSSSIAAISAAGVTIICFLLFSCACFQSKAKRYKIYRQFRLGRFCGVPPTPFVAASSLRHHQFRARTRSSTSSAVSVPLTASSYHPVTDAPVAPNPQLLVVQTSADDPLNAVIQITSGAMVTEYNPTYDFMDSFIGGVRMRRDTESTLPAISSQRLQIVQSIGQGAFSEVFHGVLKTTAEDSQETDFPVAIKTPYGLVTGQMEHDLLMEAIIMNKFHHPNIVHLIGVCLDRTPKMIVLELLEGGDLKTFLRQSRPMPGVACSVHLLELVQLSLDVAKGCEYLEQNHFIHRDIAARNCLLTTKAAGRTAKITDFGMAKDIYSDDYYRKGGRAILPVKWMPPEAFLDGIFTSKTDVWSFGVLMWEVFSLGYMPYPGRGNQEVMQFVADGGRLEAPSACPTSIYATMELCWHKDPSERPNFTQIIATLQRCFSDPDVRDAPFPVWQSYPYAGFVDVTNQSLPGCDLADDNVRLCPKS